MAKENQEVSKNNYLSIRQFLNQKQRIDKDIKVALIDCVQDVYDYPEIDVDLAESVAKTDLISNMKINGYIGTFNSTSSRTFEISNQQALKDFVKSKDRLNNDDIKELADIIPAPNGGEWQIIGISKDIQKDNNAEPILGLVFAQKSSINQKIEVKICQISTSDPFSEYISYSEDRDGNLSQNEEKYKLYCVRHLDFTLPSMGENETQNDKQILHEFYKTHEKHTVFTSEQVRMFLDDEHVKIKKVGESNADGLNNLSSLIRKNRGFLPLTMNASSSILINNQDTKELANQLNKQVRNAFDEDYGNDFWNDLIVFGLEKLDDSTLRIIWRTSTDSNNNTSLILDSYLSFKPEQGFVLHFECSRRKIPSLKQIDFSKIKSLPKTKVDTKPNFKLENLQYELEDRFTSVSPLTQIQINDQRLAQNLKISDLGPNKQNHLKLKTEKLLKNLDNIQINIENIIEDGIETIIHQINDQIFHIGWKLIGHSSHKDIIQAIKLGSLKMVAQTTLPNHINPNKFDSVARIQIYFEITTQKNSKSDFIVKCQADPDSIQIIAPKLEYAPEVELIDTREYSQVKLPELFNNTKNRLKSKDIHKLFKLDSNQDDVPVKIDFTKFPRNMNGAVSYRLFQNITPDERNTSSLKAVVECQCAKNENLSGWVPLIAKAKKSGVGENSIVFGYLDSESKKLITFKTPWEENQSKQINIDFYPNTKYEVFDVQEEIDQLNSWLDEEKNIEDASTEDSEQEPDIQNTAPIGFKIPNFEIFAKGMLQTRYPIHVISAYRRSNNSILKQNLTPLVKLDRKLCFPSDSNNIAEIITHLKSASPDPTLLANTLTGYYQQALENENVAIHALDIINKENEAEKTLKVALSLKINQSQTVYVNLNLSLGKSANANYILTRTLTNPYLITKQNYNNEADLEKYVSISNWNTIDQSTIRSILAIKEPEVVTDIKETTHQKSESDNIDENDVQTSKVQDLNHELIDKLKIKLHFRNKDSDTKDLEKKIFSVESLNAITKVYNNHIVKYGHDSGWAVNVALKLDRSATEFNLFNDFIDKISDNFLMDYTKKSRTDAIYKLHQSNKSQDIAKTINYFLPADIDVVAASPKDLLDKNNKHYTIVLQKNISENSLARATILVTIEHGKIKLTNNKKQVLNNGNITTKNDLQYQIISLKNHKNQELEKEISLTPITKKLRSRRSNIPRTNQDTPYDSRTTHTESVETDLDVELSEFYTSSSFLETIEKSDTIETYTTVIAIIIQYYRNNGIFDMILEHLKHQSPAFFSHLQPFLNNEKIIPTTIEDYLDQLQRQGNQKQFDIVKTLNDRFVKPVENIKNETGQRDPKALLNKILFDLNQSLPRTQLELYKTRFNKNKYVYEYEMIIRALINHLNNPTSDLGLYLNTDSLNWGKTRNGQKIHIPNFTMMNYLGLEVTYNQTKIPNSANVWRFVQNQMLKENIISEDELKGIVTDGFQKKKLLIITQSLLNELEKKDGLIYNIDKFTSNENIESETEKLLDIKDWIGQLPLSPETIQLCLSSLEKDDFIIKSNTNTISFKQLINDLQNENEKSKYDKRDLVKLKKHLYIKLQNIKGLDEFKSLFNLRDKIKKVKTLTELREIGFESVQNVLNSNDKILKQTEQIEPELIQNEIDEIIKINELSDEEQSAFTLMMAIITKREVDSIDRKANLWRSSLTNAKLEKEKLKVHNKALFNSVASIELSRLYSPRNNTETNSAQTNLYSQLTSIFENSKTQDPENSKLYEYFEASIRASIRKFIDQPDLMLNLRSEISIEHVRNSILAEVESQISFIKSYNLNLDRDKSQISSFNLRFPDLVNLIDFENFTFPPSLNSAFTESKASVEDLILEASTGDNEISRFKVISNPKNTTFINTSSTWESTLNKNLAKIEVLDEYIETVNNFKKPWQIASNVNYIVAMFEGSVLFDILKHGIFEIYCKTLPADPDKTPDQRANQIAELYNSENWTDKKAISDMLNKFEPKDYLDLCDLIIQESSKHTITTNKIEMVDGVPTVTGTEEISALIDLSNTNDDKHEFIYPEIVEDPEKGKTIIYRKVVSHATRYIPITRVEKDGSVSAYWILAGTTRTDSVITPKDAGGDKPTLRSQTVRPFRDPLSRTYTNGQSENNNKKPIKLNKKYDATRGYLAGTNTKPPHRYQSNKDNSKQTIDDEIAVQRLVSPYFEKIDRLNHLGNFLPKQFSEDDSSISINNNSMLLHLVDVMSDTHNANSFKILSTKILRYLEAELKNPGTASIFEQNGINNNVLATYKLKLEQLGTLESDLSDNLEVTNLKTLSLIHNFLKLNTLGLSLLTIPTHKHLISLENAPGLSNVKSKLTQNQGDDKYVDTFDQVDNANDLAKLLNEVLYPQTELKTQQNHHLTTDTIDELFAYFGRIYNGNTGKSSTESEITTEERNIISLKNQSNQNTEDVKNLELDYRNLKGIVGIITDFVCGPQFQKELYQFNESITNQTIRMAELDMRSTLISTIYKNDLIEQNSNVLIGLSTTNLIVDTLPSIKSLEESNWLKILYLANTLEMTMRMVARLSKSNFLKDPSKTEEMYYKQTKQYKKLGIFPNFVGLPTQIRKLISDDEEKMIDNLKGLTLDLYLLLKFIDRNGDFQTNFRNQFKTKSLKTIIPLLRKLNINELESVAFPTMLGMNISDISPSDKNKKLRVDPVDFIDTHNKTTYIRDAILANIINIEEIPESFKNITFFNNVINGNNVIISLSSILLENKSTKVKTSFENFESNNLGGKSEILKLLQVTDFIDCNNHKSIKDLLEFANRLIFLKSVRFLFEQKNYPNDYNTWITELENFDLRLYGDIEKKLLDKSLNKCLKEESFKKFENPDLNLINKALSILVLQKPVTLDQFNLGDTELSRANALSLLAAYYIYFDYIAARIENHLNPNEELSLNENQDKSFDLENEEPRQIPDLQGEIVDLLTNDTTFDRVKANYENNLKKCKFILLHTLKNKVNPKDFNDTNDADLEQYTFENKMIQTILLQFQNLGNIILDLIKESKDSNEINWLKIIFFAYNYEYSATLTSYELGLEKDYKDTWKKYKQPVIPRNLIATLFKNTHPDLDKKRTDRAEKFATVITDLINQAQQIFDIAATFDQSKIFESRLLEAYFDQAPEKMINTFRDNGIFSSKNATVPELLGFEITEITKDTDHQPIIQRVSAVEKYDKSSFSGFLLIKGLDYITEGIRTNPNNTLLFKLWQTLNVNLNVNLIYIDQPKIPKLPQNQAFSLYINSLRQIKDVILKINTDYSELKSEQNGNIAEAINQTLDVFKHHLSVGLATNLSDNNPIQETTKNTNKFNLYIFRDDVEGKILNKSIERTLRQPEFAGFLELDAFKNIGPNLEQSTIWKSVKRRIENSAPVSYEFGTTDVDLHSKTLLATNYILMDFYALKAQLHINPELKTKFFGEASKDSENQGDQDLENTESEAETVELSSETIKEIESKETEINKVKLYLDLISPDYCELLKLIDVLYQWDKDKKSQLPKDFDFNNSLIKKAIDLEILPSGNLTEDNGASYQLENLDKISEFYDELVSFLPTGVKLEPFYGNTEKLETAIQIHKLLENILPSGQSINIIQSKLSQTQDTIFNLRTQTFTNLDCQLLYKSIKILTQNSYLINDLGITVKEPGNTEFKNRTELLSYLGSYEYAERIRIFSIIQNLIELSKMMEFKINHNKIAEFNTEIKRLEETIKALKTPNQDKVEIENTRLTKTERKALKELKDGENQRILNFKASIVELFILQKYLESVTEVKDLDPDVSWALTYRSVFPNSPVVEDFNTVSNTIPQNHTMEDLERISLQNYDNSNKIHQERNKTLNAIISLNLALNQLNTKIDSEIKELENTDIKDINIEGELEIIQSRYSENIETTINSLESLRILNPTSHAILTSSLKRTVENVKQLCSNVETNEQISNKNKNNLIAIHKENKKTAKDLIRTQLDLLPKIGADNKTAKAIEYEMNRLDALRKFEILENLINTYFPDNIKNKKDVRDFFEVMNIYLTKLRPGLTEDELGNKEYIDKLWESSEKLGAVFHNSFDSFKPNFLNLFPNHNKEIMEIFELEINQKSDELYKNYNTEQITRYTIAMGFARALNFYLSQEPKAVPIGIDTEGYKHKADSIAFFEELRLNSQKPTPVEDLVKYVFSQNTISIEPKPNNTASELNKNSNETIPHLPRTELNRSLVENFVLSEDSFDSATKVYTETVKSYFEILKESPIQSINRSENSALVIKITAGNVILESIKTTNDVNERKWYKYLFMGYVMELGLEVFKEGETSEELKNAFTADTKTFPNLIYNYLEQSDPECVLKNKLIESFQKASKKFLTTTLIRAGQRTSEQLFDPSILGFKLEGIDISKSKTSGPKEAIKVISTDYIENPDLSMSFTASMLAKRSYTPMQDFDFNISHVSNVFNVLEIIKNSAIKINKSTLSPDKAFEKFKSSFTELGSGILFLADNLESLTENEQNRIYDLANTVFTDMTRTTIASFNSLIGRNDFFTKNENDPKGEFDMFDFSLESRQLLSSLIDQTLKAAIPETKNFASVDRKALKQMIYIRFMSDDALEKASKNDPNFGNFIFENDKQKALTTLASMYVMTQFQIIKANEYIQSSKDPEKNRLMQAKLTEKKETINSNYSLKASIIESSIYAKLDHYKITSQPNLSNAYIAHLSHTIPESPFVKAVQRLENSKEQNVSPNEVLKPVMNQLTERKSLLNATNCLNLVLQNTKEDTEKMFEKLDNISGYEGSMEAMEEALESWVELLSDITDSLKDYELYNNDAYNRLLAEVAKTFREVNIDFNQTNHSIPDLKDIYLNLNYRLTKILQKEINSLPKIESNKESVKYEIQRLEVSKKFDELKSFYNLYLPDVVDTDAKYQFEYMEYLTAFLKPDLKIREIPKDISKHIGELFDRCVDTKITKDLEFIKNHTELFRHFFNGEVLEIYNLTKILSEENESFNNNFNDEEQTKYVLARAYMNLLAFAEKNTNGNPLAQEKIQEIMF